MTNDKASNDYEDLKIMYNNIIHDIKTPISVIYTVINIMKNHENIDSELQGNLNMIESNLFTMMRIINNVKDISKIETGSCKIEYANVEIVSRVKNIVNNVIPLASKRGIEIYFNCNLPSRIISTDIYMIERILINLLSNAIKYSKENTKIIVELNLSKNKLYLTVKDNGNGIKYRNIEKIFDLYETKSGNFKDNSQGLGLFIVKKFTKILNGKTIAKNHKNGAEIGITFDIIEATLKTENIIKIEDFYKNNMVQIELNELMKNISYK